MTTSQQIYATVKRLYPDMTDEATARMMCVHKSMMSHMKHNRLVGLNVAKWMAEHHDGMNDVYQLLTTELEAKHKAAAEKRKREHEENRPKNYDHIDIHLDWPVVHAQPEVHW